MVEGWRIPRAAPDPALRAALEAEADERGLEVLERRLAAVDPVALERGRGNLRRIVRALEVHALTGEPMSAQEGKAPPPFRFLQLGLALVRPALHARIDARVERMIAAGLVEEVQALLARGYDHRLPALSSIGYAEIVQHLQGQLTLTAAVERIKANTHRYVRHQETWLRRNRALHWFDVAEPGWEERLRALVRAFLDADSPASAAASADDARPPADRNAERGARNAEQGNG